MKTDEMYETRNCPECGKFMRIVACPEHRACPFYDKDECVGMRGHKVGRCLYCECVR